MANAAGRSSGKYGESEQADLIFEIFGEHGSQITGDDDDAARSVETLGKFVEARGIQRIFQALQIFQIAIDGIRYMGMATGIGSDGAHGIGGSGESDGKIVQVLLEFAEAIEAENTNDTDDCGGIGVKTFGHGANAQEDETARMFKNRAKDFLAFDGKLAETFLQINGLRR